MWKQGWHSDECGQGCLSSASAVRLGRSKPGHRLGSLAREHYDRPFPGGIAPTAYWVNGPSFDGNRTHGRRTAFFSFTSAAAISSQEGTFQICHCGPARISFRSALHPTIVKPGEPLKV